MPSDEFIQDLPRTEDVTRCELCNEPIDYCQGHGALGAAELFILDCIKEGMSRREAVTEAVDCGHVHPDETELFLRSV